jgi:hypothetical protein
MTRLREALEDVAAEAPAINLTEWAIAGSRRRRRTRLTIAAATATVVTAMAVFTGNTLLAIRDKPVVAAETGKIPELPSRGVGPLSHAFKTFCRMSGPIPPDCRNGEWRVVTKDGEIYHLPQAGGISKEAANERFVFYPLAISRDGRMIAYYSRQARTFQVRDLAQGTVRTAAAMVAEPKPGDDAWRLVISDNGRHLVFTTRPSKKQQGLIFDMAAGRTYPLPAGWDPRAIDGTTVALARDWHKGQRPGVWLMPLAGGGTPAWADGRYTRFSPPTPAGTSMAALRLDKAARLDGTITTFDTRSGKARKTVTIRGLPKAARPNTLGAWLNASEVTFSALPTEHIRETRQVTYAVNVETGQARQLSVYHPQHVVHLVIPGVAPM